MQTLTIKYCFILSDNSKQVFNLHLDSQNLDLLENTPDFSINDVNLLKQGRHFRLPGGSKAVVGRNERENNLIENLALTEDLLLIPMDLPGPSVLCRGNISHNDMYLAAGLVAAYTKGGTIMDVEIKGSFPHENGHNIRDVKPPDKNTISRWRIGNTHFNTP